MLRPIAMQDPAIRKRSVLIAGHATSVSLEPEFWDELRQMAEARGLSLNALIAEVDAGRGARNLSSALRVHALLAARRQDREA